MTVNRQDTHLKDRDNTGQVLFRYVLDLPLECQLDLFDKVVVPVLLYGSEVWGFEKLDLI